MHGGGGAAAPSIGGLAGAAAVGCLSISLVLGLLSISLLAFQIGLITRGETTWEHLRRERINESMRLPLHVRPYDRGTCYNCAAFCLGVTVTNSGVVAAADPVVTSGVPAQAGYQPAALPLGKAIGQGPERASNASAGSGT